MKNSKPLDDLEMHELLALIYPEHIQSDEDQYFELSQEVCESAAIDLGDGFEVPLADLLGRVVMLTLPMASCLTDRLLHCLGKVTVADGRVQMVAAVRRDVQPEQQVAPGRSESAEFNRAIDFAIEQGTEGAAFLRCWREGDTGEWPEFYSLGVASGRDA